MFDTPMIGRFESGTGMLHGQDAHEGLPIRVRHIWSDITFNSARGEQACSTDGLTWEVNWIADLQFRHQMHFHAAAHRLKEGIVCWTHRYETVDEITP